MNIGLNYFVIRQRIVRVLPHREFEHVGSNITAMCIAEFDI